MHVDKDQIATKLCTSESMVVQNSGNKTLPYKEPFWSGIPKESYMLEVLKNGVIIDKIDLSTSYTVFGKVKSCNYVLDNPSISRYHAVLQYRSIPGDGQNVGMYIYDMNSTNGTFVNKKKIEPQTYTRIRVGYCLRFGTSSRMFVLVGPDHDLDDENDITHEQMKVIRARFKQIVRKLQERKLQEDSLLLNANENEDENEKNTFDSDAEVIQNCIESEGSAIYDESNAFYLSDPKSALKSFFEREGQEMCFEYEEVAFRRIKCKINLPFYDDDGNPVCVEVEHVGKKKEAAALCALDACKILDQAHVLQQVIPKHVAVKRNWEANDYYNSDEDTFLDRTGEIERKRQKRMAKYGNKSVTQEANTFSSLKKKLSDVIEEELSIRLKLLNAKSAERALIASDVDSYVRSLLNGALDSKERFKLKRRLVEIREEKKQYSRLIEVAAPTKYEINQWNDTLQKLIQSCDEKLREAEAQQEMSANEEKKIDIDDGKDNVEEHFNAAESEVNESRNELSSTLTSCCKEEEVLLSKNTAEGREVIERDTTEQRSDCLKTEQTNSGSVRKAKTCGFAQSHDEISMMENYVNWQPPAGQTGDGRTALNDKYGY